MALKKRRPKRRKTAYSKKTLVGATAASLAFAIAAGIFVKGSESK